MRKLKRFISATSGVKPSIESANREIEYCLYAKLKPDHKWSQEPVEEQTQASMLTVPVEGSDPRLINLQSRVRKSVTSEATEYTLTLKVRTSDELGVNELNAPVDDAFFTNYSKTVDQIQHKRRYVYPIEGTDLKWEVDHFLTNTDQWSPWVKLDLEVPEPLDDLPPLPFEFDEVIYKPREPEHKDFIQSLYAGYNRRGMM